MKNIEYDIPLTRLLVELISQFKISKPLVLLEYIFSYKHIVNRELLLIRTWIEEDENERVFLLYKEIDSLNKKQLFIKEREKANA